VEMLTLLSATLNAIFVLYSVCQGEKQDIFEAGHDHLLPVSYMLIVHDHLCILFYFI
jgi:hypothetical protein